MAGRAQTTVLDDDERFDHHLPVQPREVAAGQRRIPLPAASLFVQLKGRQRKRRRRARHLEVSRIHILRMRSIRNRLGEGNQPGERIGVRVLAGRGLPRDRIYIRRGLSGSYHHEQNCDKSGRYKPGGAKIKYYI